MLKPRDRLQEGQLHFLGQRRRNPVGIDRVVVETLGLEEDLVAVALAEAHHLVLDRGAIARPDALDLARIDRREFEILLDDPVPGRRGPGDVAIDLGVVIRCVRKEKGTGGWSPGCTSSEAQSMLPPSSRGGVPVLRRPSWKPSP